MNPPAPPGVTEDDKAPFIAMTIFARGLLNRLTRIYLPGQETLDSDPLLASISIRSYHPDGVMPIGRVLMA